jgi:hypothetical protein
MADLVNTVIMVTGEGMGRADVALQRTLAGKYFQLLLDDDKLPAAICFITEGVRLVCEGSPVLEPLRALSEQGTRLIVCNTCLNFLNLTGNVQIGIVGGMGDIIEAQWRADKVITI